MRWRLCLLGDEPALERDTTAGQPAERLPIALDARASPRLTATQLQYLVLVAYGTHGRHRAAAAFAALDGGRRSPQVRAAGATSDLSTADLKKVFTTQETRLPGQVNEYLRRVGCPGRITGSSRRKLEHLALDLGDLYALLIRGDLGFLRDWILHENRATIPMCTPFLTEPRDARERTAAIVSEWASVADLALGVLAQRELDRESIAGVGRAIRLTEARCHTIDLFPKQKRPEREAAIGRASTRAYVQRDTLASAMHHLALAVPATTTIGAADLVSLGVRPAAIAGIARLPPFVTREALLDAVADKFEAARNADRLPLVLTRGASAVGKSRLLLEALRRHYGQLPIVAPLQPEQVQAALDLAEVTAGSGSVPTWTGILWLEDLELWVANGVLSPARLRTMRTTSPGLLIAGTVGGKGSALVVDNDQLRAPLASLVEHAHVVDVPSGLDADELAAASELYGSATVSRFEEHGLGAWMIAGPALDSRYAELATTNPPARAVLDAAISWRTAGSPYSVHEDDLYRTWCCARQVADTRPEAFDQALQEAAHLVAVNQVSPIARDTDREEPAWAVHDHLAANHRQPLTGCQERTILISDAAAALVDIGLVAYTDNENRQDFAEKAWRRADELGDPTGSFNVGILLHERGDLDGAEQALRRADERGELEATLTLGLLLHERGDLDGAEAVYRRASEHGDPRAAFNLGILLHERGDLDGAEHALRRADERGESDATFYLGVLLYERGYLAGAEHVLRRADERGNPNAALHVGLVLKERGDLAGAEAIWRRADEHGDAEAAFNLGLLLHERGDVDGAEHAWRRADERGDAAAANNLGVLLKGRGDLVGAEAAYRRAEERGDPGAANMVGVVLYEQGDLAGAEAIWRRADEQGDPEAAFNLGVLLHERGDADAAEAAYRRAGERGHHAAANNLGVLLNERGDLDDAEAAYRRADEHELPKAANNLGIVLYEQDNLDEAEQALRRAAEDGDLEAVFNLGVVLEERGDLAGAEAAYRRADEHDHPKAANNLGIVLDRQGDPIGAEHAWRRAVEYGDPNAAFNLGVLLHERGDRTGAERAFELARSLGLEQSGD